MYEGERNNLAVDAPCGQGEVLNGGRDYEEARKVLASCGQGQYGYSLALSFSSPSSCGCNEGTA